MPVTVRARYWVHFCESEIWLCSAIDTVVLISWWIRPSYNGTQLYVLQCYWAVYSVAIIHWGRNKMSAIFQITFSNAFSWMVMYEFQFKISLMFASKDPSNNIPALVQIMLIILLTHILVCVTLPQWVNSLWPSVHIISWLSLVQEMACLFHAESLPFPASMLTWCILDL